MVKMANVRGQQKQAGSWNNADRQKLYLMFRSGDAVYRGNKLTNDEIRRVQGLDDTWTKYHFKNFTRNYQKAAAEFKENNPNMHDDNMTSVAFIEGRGQRDDYIPDLRDDSDFVVPPSRAEGTGVPESILRNSGQGVEDVCGMMSRATIASPGYQRRMNTQSEGELPFLIDSDSVVNVTDLFLYVTTRVEDDDATTFKTCSVQVGPFVSGDFDGPATIQIRNRKYIEIKVERSGIADSPAEVVDALQANGGSVPKTSATYAAIVDEMSALRRQFGSRRYTVFYVELPFVVDEEPYNDGDHFPGRRFISKGQNGENGTILLLQYRSPRIQTDRVEQYTVSNNHTMHANLVYEDPPPLECRNCKRTIGLRSLGDGTACCELCHPSASRPNGGGWFSRR